MLFPISTERSPLMATIYTFTAPVVSGSLAAFAVNFTLLRFWPNSDPVTVLSAAAFALTALSVFKGLEFHFESGGEVSFRETIIEAVRIPLFWAIPTYAACASIPWLRDQLPGHLEALDYPKTAEFVSEFHITLGLSVGVWFLVAVFMGVLTSFYNKRQPTRGRKLGTIATIRQALTKRRKKREATREDRILAQIHRDGGTSKVPAHDMEFLKRRGKLPRHQRV